jgi:hypothetical protein
MEILDFLGSAIMLCACTRVAPAGQILAMTCSTPPA